MSMSAAATPRAVPAFRLHHGAAFILVILAGMLTSFGTRLLAQTITLTEINPSHSDLGDADGASGGRINHLAMAPGAGSTYYAASEWGGLFKSTNYGRTWSRLDHHLPTVTWDVKVSPADHRLVIATSRYDGRAVSGSGINVSNDEGDTWTHPQILLPQQPFCTALSVSEPEAYGISFDPDDSRNIFVGTNCGLAFSKDSGATWHFGGPPGAGLAARIWSVLVQHGGIIDVCGDDGHERSVDGGKTWTG